MLITRFLTDDGVVEIHDFMPILRSHDPEHRQSLVRKVVSVRGSTWMRADVARRFDYGRARHRTGQYQVTFRGPGLTLALNSSVAQRIDEHGDADAEFEMSDGGTEVFVLEVLGQDAEPGRGERQRDGVSAMPVLVIDRSGGLP